MINIDLIEPDPNQSLQLYQKRAAVERSRIDMQLQESAKVSGELTKVIRNNTEVINELRVEIASLRTLVSKQR